MIDQCSYQTRLLDLLGGGVAKETALYELLNFFAIQLNTYSKEENNESSNPIGASRLESLLQLADEAAGVPSLLIPNAFSPASTKSESESSKSTNDLDLSHFTGQLAILSQAALTTQLLDRAKIPQPLLRQLPGEVALEFPQSSDCFECGEETPILERIILRSERTIAS